MCINKPPNVHPINSSNPIVVVRGEGAGIIWPDQTSECRIRATRSGHLSSPATDITRLFCGRILHWLVSRLAHMKMLEYQLSYFSTPSDDVTVYHDKRINVSSWSFDSKTMNVRIRGCNMCCGVTTSCS